VAASTRRPVPMSSAARGQCLRIVIPASPRGSSDGARAVVRRGNALRTGRT
jgi:hypothetical protein